MDYRGTQFNMAHWLIIIPPLFTPLSPMHYLVQKPLLLYAKLPQHFQSIFTTVSGLSYFCLCILHSLPGGQDMLTTEPLLLFHRSGLILEATCSEFLNLLLSEDVPVMQREMFQYSSVQSFSHV